MNPKPLSHHLAKALTRRQKAQEASRAKSAALHAQAQTAAAARATARSAATVRAGRQPPDNSGGNQ
jgi:hypothetical protein